MLFQSFQRLGSKQSTARLRLDHRIEDKGNPSPSQVICHHDHDLCRMEHACLGISDGEVIGDGLELRQNYLWIQAIDMLHAHSVLGGNGRDGRGSMQSQN